MSTNTVQSKQKNLTPRKLTETETADLKLLVVLAQQARGAYYSEEVAKASQDLSRLLFEHLESGVRYRDLAEATGMQWRSIKARLFRHGYVHPVPPSQKNKVFQGPKKPGPKCDHDPKRYRERTNKKTGKVIHIECLDCRRNKRIEKKKTQQAQAEKLAA